MADGLYVSMCGAVTRAEQLDSVADNLANAQTPGFKASRPAFESFLPSSGSSDKVYPAAVATGFDLRPGVATRTGNPLDLYPEDGAFIAVRGPGETVAYTRDGRLSLDAERRLVTQGHLVLSRSGQPISIPPDVTPTVDSSGKVRAGDLMLGELTLARLDGPIDRVGPSLLAPSRGGQAIPVEAAVRIGELDMGNASALDSTIALISAQRSYDASMQAIQTYNQMNDRANQLGRVQ
jgi:flagellar basal-body rod protein FlgF